MVVTCRWLTKRRRKKRKRKAREMGRDANLSGIFRQPILAFYNVVEEAPLDAVNAVNR